MADTHAAIVADMVQALKEACAVLHDLTPYRLTVQTIDEALARAKLLDLDRAVVRNDLAVRSDAGHRHFLIIPLRPTPGDPDV